jgi:uncharacterized protein
MAPLLTLEVHQSMHAAVLAKVSTGECSLDLGRSTSAVDVDESGCNWQGQRFPWMKAYKDRTIYYWVDSAFEPAARFTTSLIKLVPTKWRPPTCGGLGYFAAWCVLGKATQVISCEKNVDVIWLRSRSP